MTQFTDALRRGSRSAPRSEAVDSAPASTPWPTIALATAAALAVAFRLRMLLMGRSLWLDETALALNICGRSFADLLKPLAHDQAAPIGFLYIERLSVVLLGPTELALRLFPFLASIATLILIYRFCATNYGPWAAACGLALAGTCPALSYYSGETKQYASDVAMGLMILVLTSDALRLGLSARRASVLAVAGALAVWISHPSVFVLAAAGTTLIVKEALGRRWACAMVAAGVSAFWLAHFAVGYFLFIKELHSNTFLDEYWESAFLQFPPTSAKALREYPVIGFGLFASMYQNLAVDFDLCARMAVPMAATWLIGVIVLYRQGRREILALLLLPLAFAVLASMLHKYPLKGRLALFTAASTLPVIVAGIWGLMSTRDALTRATGAVLLGAALLLPTVEGVQLLVKSPRLHDARSVLTSVAKGWRPGDVVVVDRFSELPFYYYQRYGKVDGLDRVVPTPSPLSFCQPDELVRELDKWKGNPRVWVLLDTALPDPANLSRDALRVLLDQRGRPIESYSCRRYSAHLYEFH